MRLKGFKNTSNLNFSNADGDGVLADSLVGISTITDLQQYGYTLNAYSDGQNFIRIYIDGNYEFAAINQLSTTNGNVSIKNQSSVSDDNLYIRIPLNLVEEGIQGFAFQLKDGAYVFSTDKWIWAENAFLGNAEVADPIDDSSDEFTSDDISISYKGDGTDTIILDLSEDLKSFLGSESSEFNFSIYDEIETDIIYVDAEPIKVENLPIEIDGISSPDGDIGVGEIDLGAASEEFSLSTTFTTEDYDFTPLNIINNTSCLRFSYKLSFWESLLSWYGEPIFARWSYEVVNLDTDATSQLIGGNTEITEQNIDINDFSSISTLGDNEQLTGNAFVDYIQNGEVIGTSAQLQINTSDCPKGTETTITEPEEEEEGTIRGCTDPTATNYNADANLDDGSCLFVGDNNNTDASNDFDVITESMSSEDEYGNLIDDTILVIQQLQTQLDNAPTQAEVDNIQEELDAANEQLTTLTSSEGLLANLESYVALAEAGNYNGELANVADVVIDGDTIVDASVINTSLNTISNNFDTLGTTTNELATANGILDSIAGVLDITTGQGEQAYLDALNEYASDPTLVATQAEVDQAFEDGAASVDQVLTQLDITAATEEGQATGEALFAEGTDAYNIIFNLGEETGNSAGYATGYAEGAASVTPEDGITQNDVTQAFLEGQLDALDGYTSATAAFEAGETAGFADGVASVTYLQSSYDLGADSVTPEDGITQADVDAVQGQLNELAAQIVTAQTELTSPNTEIQTLITNAQDAATTAAQLTDANEGVVTQDAYDLLVSALTTAESAVDNLEAQIESLGGDNTTINAAYDNLEAQLDLANELLIDAEADNTAYAEFLQSLTGDLGRLEKFLTDNYDYTPYQASSITAQAGNMADGKSQNEDGSTNEDFLTNPYSFSGGNGMATGLTPRNQVFVNFRGHAKYVKDGFAKFKGQAPMSTFKRADGDDDSNKLNKTTKTGMQIIGVAVGGYILYKLLGKK